jgi:aminomethyltransferase
VVDDLITYFGDEQNFRVVVNAGTRDKDTAWLKRWAPPFKVDIQPRTDLAMVAVQGPNARAKAAKVIGKGADAVLGMKPFFSRQLDSHFVSRTGYTGEDGWEIIVPAEDIAAFWAALRDAGVRQCGLGARDTLRLEAGMNLYGSDMDETVTPLESGLAWTVAFGGSRDFVGRSALEKQLADGVARQLTGLLLEDRGVLRAHQKVFVGAAGEGEVTSGTFSPTLERSIALARLPAAAAGRVEVDIRGKRVPARIVKPPFARNGKVRIEL